MGRDGDRAVDESAKATPEGDRRPVLDYARPTPQRHRLRNLLVILGVTWLLVILAILHSSGPRSRARPNALKCASHLRLIGQAIQMYASRSDNKSGAYPARLDQLVESGDLTPEELICPASNDDPARGATTAAVLVDLATPGRCSYSYVGAGLTTATADADTVVAYDRPANHTDPEVLVTHVLFGDGHVEALNASQMKAIVAATTRPVRLTRGR